MTAIAALLNDAAKQLADSDSAALDAELLLSYCLNAPRSHLYAWPDREIEAEQLSGFKALLQRRRDGEPLAYILGRQEFWSLSLAVTSDTLIPRPETETLVEAAIAALKAASPQPEVLDLGTGSGAIALAIASECSAARVTGVDCDFASVALAQRNAAALKLVNVSFLQSDWFSEIQHKAFDVIVSNPPYIPAGDPHLDRGDVRFEPRRALVSGSDGLDAIRIITATAPAFFKAGGQLLIEHGYDQAVAVRALFTEHGFTDIGSVQDIAGIERVTVGRKIQ